ncbi:MAG: DUF4435 domain-containing protein [Deltaproteobacteria bacterium]|nr:DUF4435 domain-containing protein [Deltaproteobacteria bacterium]
MDDQRHELFVEGESDRILLEWLARDTINPDVRILELDKYVEVDVHEGGAKGRILIVAANLQDRTTRARFFVDADYDILLGRAIPANVWITDRKDIEGYLAEITVMKKAIYLGLQREALNPWEVLSNVIVMCRDVGLLRIVSQRDCMDLPFQRTPAAKYVRKKLGKIVFEFPSFLKALLHNAKISLEKLSFIEAAHSQIRDELEEVDDLRIIHGKDFLGISEAYVCKLGLEANQFARMLWSAFDESITARAPNLHKVLQFIKNPHA